MIKLDPITSVVIQNNLRSIAREMFRTLVRSGSHPIIYDVHDFGIELLDADCSTIAQAPGLPVFMGCLSFNIKICVDRMGRENLKSGDVVISSGPAICGTHIPDVTIFTPIFYKNTIFGYAGVKAHWVDVGMVVPLGPTETTDVFGEGIRIPPVKLYKDGVLDPEIRAFILENSRAPADIWAEAEAQIACCYKGKERVTALLDKYGSELVSTAIQEMFDHDERLARAEIEKMPDGVWTAEDYMDDNFVDKDKPVKIKVTATIHGSDLTLDFSGSAEEQKGPINSHIITTEVTARMIVKTLTAPTLPVSEGSYRPVKVIAPLGSLFTPGPLAAASFYYETVGQVMDLVNRALHPAIPEKTPACSGSSICTGGLTGISLKTGKFIWDGQPFGVGMGADFSSDGESVVIIPFDCGARTLSIEVEEANFPVLIERYEIDQDSGGPGKYRGGLGAKRDYRLLQPMTLLAVSDRAKFPHWGLDGGKPGRRNYSVVQSKSRGEFEVLKVSNLELDEGDRWLHRPGGGGGYGNPLQRDPEAVRQDVINEYISFEAAKGDYGVVIDPHTFDYDIEATKLMRKEKGRSEVDQIMQ